jgi:hypothetical protein
MTLTTLLDSPPKIHNWSSGELTSSGLPTPVFEFMDKILNPETRSLETGMGISTALFALKGTTHTCINPDEQEIVRFREYVNKNHISIENMEFVGKRSDEVWFDLKENIWDFILIDGCHGFPIPYMDWYFFSQGLKINGHVVIDDTNISTGKELKAFLSAEDSWKLVAPFSPKTAVFKKVKDFDYNKEFNCQPYILAATKAINKPNIFMDFARSVKRRLKKFINR